MGRRLDGRGHEAVPLAQAAAGRGNRVPGMDGRKSSPPLEVPEVTTALIGRAIQKPRFCLKPPQGGGKEYANVSGSSLAALSNIRFILFILISLT